MSHSFQPSAAKSASLLALPAWHRGSLTSPSLISGRLSCAMSVHCALASTPGGGRQRARNTLKSCGRTWQAAQKTCRFVAGGGVETWVGGGAGEQGIRVALAHVPAGPVL